MFRIVRARLRPWHLLVLAVILLLLLLLPGTVRAAA